MKETYKAVFLPIDDRILSLYKGYILNGNMVPGLKKEDIYKETSYYEDNYKKSKIEHLFRLIIVIPLLPVFVILLFIAAIFKRIDAFSEKVEGLIDSLLGVLFKKKKKTNYQRRKKYEDVIEEDVLGFLNHCRKNLAKVFVYSYRPLSDAENKKIQFLIKNNFVDSCIIISNFTEIQNSVLSESVSWHNSFIVVKDLKEMSDLKNSGSLKFFITNKNIVLWEKIKTSNQSGKDTLEWNSIESLLRMKRNITYYLEAKKNIFLSNDIIIFIEDVHDPFLNNYIQKNLALINERLLKRNIQLLYFPLIKNIDHIMFEKTYDLLCYRNPLLYSISKSELQLCINLLIEKLSPNEFYRLIIKELDLPYFPKPALLRSIFGGFSKTANSFTYKTIEYSTESDLNGFFDWYIRQLQISDDFKGKQYANKPPERYDTDECFYTAENDSVNLKNQIDAIMAEGQYGAIAQAIIYMLETIKEEQPDILARVKPLIEKRHLLESKVILSSLCVDKYKNIFLTDFGNIEVKMHALPKTVYLFFLKYPAGVRIKELYQYKKQLLEIYSTITNKSENEEIKKAIDDLVDVTKPNINQQCSRIRKTFRDIMDEHIAKHYYIDGLSGEPKKIILPQNLLDIRYI